ncbi:hypothetical protein A5N15_06895 [Rothia kristinae]|uniref:Uncharacterized protein n=1 Tax=Rothia kristinae TaxID=37923 RepID=A0A657IUL9_9MICC|nr:hypothetical protein A5N15_06895 [Rothia kristinae]
MGLGQGSGGVVPGGELVDLDLPALLAHPGEHATSGLGREVLLRTAEQDHGGRFHAAPGGLLGLGAAAARGAWGSFLLGGQAGPQTVGQLLHG